MEVFEAVRTVLAVRAFQDKPVPPESVQRIIEAARLTASSQNGQPWHFIVVEKRDTLGKLGKLMTHGGYVAQAPMAIVVVIDRTPVSVSDGSRSVQSMILTAWAEGVGSKWGGWLGIPGINKPLRLPRDPERLAGCP